MYVCMYNFNPMFPMFAYSIAFPLHTSHHHQHIFISSDLQEGSCIVTNDSGFSSARTSMVVNLKQYIIRYKQHYLFKHIFVKISCPSVSPFV